MSQSYGINQSSTKKIITRSVANTNQTTGQNTSRDKLQSNRIPISGSVNTSQQSNQRSFAQEQKPKVNTRRESSSKQATKQQQRPDKNMFYSELHIETHDNDVPLVRILKVNQQLLRSFIQYSSSIQNMMVMGRTRSISLGFRTMASHLIRSQRYNLKTTKLKQVLNKLLRTKLQLGMSKLFATRNKFHIKQKALILLNRLLISKTHAFYRYFFKNAQEKKLMGIVMNKVQQDELVKMKMNLEIFKQITFSKEFILKCRPLIRYNPNNKGMFEKQLVKANFQQSIKSQLQRYEKIRQNVDNRNPNTQSDSQQSKKGIVKRKPVSSSYNDQSQYYENQMVLMAIKSFNLSLVDTRLAYEQKITQLNEHITQLQTEQRYVELEETLNVSVSHNKVYESAINELYSRSDEQIRKLITQFPLSKDQQLYKKKLLPVVSTQRTKYQKSFQKHQKLFMSKQQALDEYLTKFYKSRYFTLDLCHQLLNIQKKNQYQIYQEVYHFITTHLEDLVESYLYQDKVKQLIDKVKKNKHQLDIMHRSSLIIVNLSQCFLAIHHSYQAQRQKTIKSINQAEQQVKTSLSRQNQSSKKSLQKDQFSIKSLQKDHSSIKSLQKEKSKHEQTKIIQRKTSQTNKISEQQSSKKQPPKTQSKPIKQLEITQQTLPSIVTKQVTSYNVLMDVLRTSITEYIRSNNQNYQNGEKLIVENNSIKKSLLPETKGKTKLQDNIQINSFLQQINSQVQLLIKNLSQSLISANQSQLEVKEITDMISLFYELILSSTDKQSNQTNANKFAQLNKKWTQLCKTKTNSKQKLSLINTFNSILMIQKQLNTKQSKPQQNFSEQLKNILKQKLQYQKLYNQSDKKLLIKQEEYNIIEKQNKQFLKKNLQTEKQLNKLKSQRRNYQQNLDNNQQSITRLRQELNVYMTTAKNQAQENNKLNRELTRIKNQITSLNSELERIRLKQTQRLKQAQQKNALTLSKNTYSLSQYTQMENIYKLKIGQLQQSAAQVQTQKHQLNQIIIQLKTQLKDFQRVNEQSRFQVHKLNQEKQRNSISVTRLTQLESTYLNQIQKLEYERDELKRVITELRMSIEVDRKNHIMLDKTQYNRLKQLQLANHNLHQSVQTLQSQIAKLNKQIKNLKQQISTKNSTITDFQRQLHSNTTQLQYQYQQQSNQLKNFYQQQISQLQLTINSQQQNHQSAIKSLHTQYQHSTHTLTSTNNTSNINITNNNNSQTLQPQTHNPHSNTHTILNKHTHQLTILEYDPEKEIKSLREFIQTLEGQNEKIHNKYNMIKKELYSDETSTQFSRRSNQSSANKEVHSREFYESLIHDLKLQNDRLYGQLLKTKSSPSPSLQLLNSQEPVQELQVNEFWVGEIKRKQEHISQMQSLISELNVRLEKSESNNQSVKDQLVYEQSQNVNRETQRIRQLEQQISTKTLHYSQVEQTLRQQIIQLTERLNWLERECFRYKSQVKQLKQSQEAQSLKINLNYSELLQSTQEVKELFTSFIQATNAILYKLDRTSQIYLNFESSLQRRSSLICNNNLGKRANDLDKRGNDQQSSNIQAENQRDESEMIKMEKEQQARRAEQSIISLVEEFKTVIENNHETLKSIYQNLVCHPYTKTALELHYLKELTLTIISKFHAVPPMVLNPSHISPQPISYTYQSLREQLAAEIDTIFANTQERIKPIEEIFVQVQELIISKVQTSLHAYKDLLHLKAVNLDYTRQKLDLVLQQNLIDEQTLIRKIPHHSQYHMPYHQSYTYLSSNQSPAYQQFYTSSQMPNLKPLNPIQSYLPHHNQYHDKQSEMDSIREEKIQFLQNMSHQRRPFSGNWVPKTTSNQEYRPLTSMIEKEDFVEQNIGQSEKDVMYRSYVNPFQSTNQQFSSGRFS